MPPVGCGGSARRSPLSFAGAPAAPVLASLNYTQGDTAGGGQPIVATGTGFTSGVPHVDGVAVGSYTVDSDTQITFTLPAHAPGTVNVTVVGPGGTSSSIAFEYWSPTQITGVTRYWDAVKGVTTAAGAVSSWVDQVAGDAATQGTPANRPALVAGAFGTLAGVRFVPEQWLVCASGGESAVSPFSFFVVLRTSSTDAVATEPVYNVAQTLLGGGGWSGFGIHGGAVAYKSYDKALESWGAGISDGAAHLVGMTSDATPTRQGYKDGAAVGAASALGGTDLAYWDHLGDGYTNVDGFDGDAAAILTLAGSVISGADHLKLTKWARQRWGTP